MELFTATRCTYCYLADNRVDDFWTVDSSQVSRGFVGLEVHIPWPIADSLRTKGAGTDILGSDDRMSVYTASWSSAPVAIFNGLNPITGYPPNSPPSYYLNPVTSLPGYDTTPLVAFWVKDVVHVPGESLSGTLRAVLLQDLPATDSLTVWVADCKNGVRATRVEGGHFPMRTFNHVARNFQYFGALSQRGLAHAGDWTDMQFNFPLNLAGPIGGNPPPLETLWNETQMEIVAIAQFKASREVAQVVRVPVN